MNERTRATVSRAGASCGATPSDAAGPEQVEAIGRVAGDEDRRVAVDHDRDVARRVAGGRDHAHAIGDSGGRSERPGRVGRELDRLHAQPRAASDRPR